MKKADRLYSLAQSLAGARPNFFEIKGPSVGDRDTAAFMKELRALAASAFGADYSEKKICGENKLCVDFYFPDEETIVEVALGLRNPTSEYERDILKAIMANESHKAVRHLLFISKPGALKRLSQPGAAAMAAWAERQHGIKVEVRELTRTPAAELMPHSSGDPHA
ncbi:MAG TPA: hypothetical protein VN256_08810 [Pyrinomonadaceae bacterium]|nr:hypothetical protein [Pyrinomonadaceae bacterium]